MPKPPQTCAEIEKVFKEKNVMEHFGMAVKSTATFYKGVVEREKFSFCVFPSDKIIELMQIIPMEDRTILIDGTFTIVPVGPFKQLLIFYIEVVGNVRIWHRHLFFYCSIKKYEFFFRFFKILKTYNYVFLV